MGDREHQPASELEFAPLDATAGAEFFADLPAGAHYDAGQRRAVRDIRTTLRRLRPRAVEPGQTRGELNDLGMLDLHLPHRADAGVSIDLAYGDGYLGLTWPGGGLHGGDEWTPLYALVVEALLAGRNTQTVHSRLGRVYAIETEVWNEQGARHRLPPQRPARAALLAAFPMLPGARTTRSISLDRSPAIASH